jgi:hypothetical protein
VLIYSAASADIADAGRASLDEVAAALPAAGPGVGVAVQWGTPQGAVRRTLGPTASTPQPAPTDMSEPQTLSDFLAWGMRAVPARNYVVVIGGHAGGFLGAVEDPQRHRLMAPDQMAQAFSEAGCHPAVLVFNACYMAQAEVAAEFAPHAAYMVASQAFESGAGMALGAALGGIARAANAREAATALVSSSADVPDRISAVSALDLATMPALQQSLDHLAGVLLSTPHAVETAREHITRMRNFREDKPWDQPLTDYKDVADFTTRLEADARLPAAVRAAAAEVGNRLRPTVVAHASHGSAPAAGLSIYLPTRDLAQTHGQPGAAALSLYQRLELSRESRWGRLVAALGASVEPAPAGVAAPRR